MCIYNVHVAFLPSSSLYIITQIKNIKQTSEQMLAALKIEKADLESSLSKEKLQSIQLKHQVEEAENRNTDLYKVAF